MRTLGYFYGKRVQVLGTPAEDRLRAVVSEGLADEMSGDVELLAGHVSRIGAELLMEDSDGFAYAYRAATVEDAEHVMRQHASRVHVETGFLVVGHDDGAHDDGANGPRETCAWCP